MTLPGMYYYHRLKAEREAKIRAEAEAQIERELELVQRGREIELEFWMRVVKSLPAEVRAQFADALDAEHKARTDDERAERLLDALGR